MVTIIIYDIRAGPEYNKIKRSFYYHLRKLDLIYLNKSVIVIRNQAEYQKTIDVLSRFKDHIEAYVIEANSIERL